MALPGKKNDGYHLERYSVILKKIPFQKLKNAYYNQDWSVEHEEYFSM